MSSLRPEAGGLTLDGLPLERLAAEFGTLWAWGYNFWGELGDGTTTDRATPVQVNGLSDVTAAAAAIYHTLAVKSDGTVYAWGLNSLGQLGTGRPGVGTSRARRDHVRKTRT